MNKILVVILAVSQLVFGVILGVGVFVSDNTTLGTVLCTLYSLSSMVAGVVLASMAKELP